MKKSRLLSVLGMVVVGMVGCAPSAVQDKTIQTYYLKYNYHYTTQKGNAIGSVANFTKLSHHKILPYGSAVRVESWGSGFSLIDEKSRERINVLAKPEFLGGRSLSEYLDLILSKTPVSYAGLSELDQQGISEGRPIKGMSKQAVMIALGYPCPHKTSSPDTNVWYYWKNRFSSYPVKFEDGVVVSSGY